LHFFNTSLINPNSRKNHGEFMNSKLKAVIVVILLFLLIYIMVNPGSTEKRVDIVGSTSVQPLAEVLATAYQKNHSGILINVQGGGSGMGIRSIHDQITDVGMSSMSLKPDEKEGIIELPLGKEGIVICVNNNNNLEDLTINQIRDIFNGKITNWKEIGGPDLEIHLLTREDGSGTRTAFEDLVMGGTKIKDDAIVQSSTESIKQSVASDPGAIGYISYAHMSDDVKALRVNGVVISDESIIDGTYKIQRPFLLLIHSNENKIVKDFLKWVYSPEGIKIIKSEKIIPPDNVTQIISRINNA